MLFLLLQIKVLLLQQLTSVSVFINHLKYKAMFVFRNSIGFGQHHRLMIELDNIDFGSGGGNGTGTNLYNRCCKLKIIER